MKIKKIIMIIFLIPLIAFILPIKSCYGIVQSNKLTHASPTYTGWWNWMTSMRTTESSTGAMGYQETYNSSTLEPTTEENGADIHLMKNTEYGALVLLSSSAYGTEEKSNPKPETTTGNSTGVYMNYSSYEYTAGVTSGSAGYKPRYINQYGGAKVGDATTEISTWNNWRKHTSLPRTQTVDFGYTTSGGYTARGSVYVSRTFTIRGYSNFADSCFVTDLTLSSSFGRGSTKYKTGVVNYWNSSQPNSYTLPTSSYEFAWETMNFYLGPVPNYMGRGVAVFL